MRKIKVAHFLRLGAYSGAENVAIQIIKGTNDIIDAVYISPSGSIERYLAPLGIRHYSLPNTSIRQIKKAITAVAPDIIHAHDYYMSVCVAMVANNIPIISHLHNNPPWIKKFCFKSLAYCCAIHKFDQILCVSNSVIREYIFQEKIGNKAVVVGNPINVSDIRNKGCYDANIEKLYDIVFLGRLSTPKNPNRFLDVITEVKKEKDDIKAVMIGDGELRGEIETQLKIKNLDKNVILTGFLKNPYFVLQQARVLCITSDWEGFGLAAAEALSFGIPVICTNVGGPPEIVNSACGVVCKTKKEMVSALNILLGDNYQLERKVVGAMQRAEELDNYQDYMNNLKGLYKSLCKI